MIAYLMLTLAVALLAASFVGNKVFQTVAGGTAYQGAVNGLVTTVLAGLFYWIMNGFTCAVTPFSLLMAGLQTLFVALYGVIGFLMMARGKMAYYTIFLMAGGMTLPYLYGVLFLDEKLTPWRIAGLVVLLAGIVTVNADEGKFDRRNLLLGIGVFLLNGGVSITSKMHQIETVRPVVDTNSFCILCSVIRIGISILLLILYRHQRIPADRNRTGSAKRTLILAAAVVGAVAASAMSSILQLEGARTMPATVLYPFVSGGSIVLTSLAGCVFFREKFTVRLAVSLALCLAGTCMFL